jgi:hypothetical protein
MRKTSYLAVAALLGGCASHQPWVSPLALSYHAERDRGYNETHEGIAVGARINDRWQWNAGRLINSERHESSYVAAQYDIAQWPRVSIGVQMGVVTGYERYNVLPMALPVIDVQVSKHNTISIIALPVDGGVVAVQWRVR